MSDGVNDNGLTLKGQTLIYLLSSLPPLHNLSILKSPRQSLFFVHSFMTADLILCSVIGWLLQASCSCTPSSYSEVDTRPPGLCWGGLVMTTTWSSHRNTCSPCKCSLKAQTSSSSSSSYYYYYYYFCHLCHFFFILFWRYSGDRVFTLLNQQGVLFDDPTASIWMLTCSHVLVRFKNIEN